MSGEEGARYAPRPVLVALHGDHRAVQFFLGKNPFHLAFDELLASQLAIALVRHHNRTLAGHATEGDGRLRTAVLGALPFWTRWRNLPRLRAGLGAPLVGDSVPLRNGDVIELAGTQMQFVYR